jgi:hypothetical protein
MGGSVDGETFSFSMLQENTNNGMFNLAKEQDIT